MDLEALELGQAVLELVEELVEESAEESAWVVVLELVEG